MLANFLSHLSFCVLCRRLLVVGLLFLIQGAVQAEPSASVRIGVLSFRDMDATRKQWTPLASYLEAQIPGHQFAIQPFHLEDLSRAVDNGEVDFILTQPEHYVLLRSRHRLAAVATLTQQVGERSISHLGGVIFTRVERADIQQLKDLRGQHIAATHAQSLGSYRIQQWTLRQAGIELPRDAKKITFTGQPQDKVVDEVLSGRADVGFVRTGLLESMQSEGKLDRNQIKIINLKSRPDFPQLLSTELVPEWPFSAAPRAPDDLVKAVTLALLEIPPGHPAAKAGKFHGFSPPADYSGLESIMMELRAHPERLEHFDLRDVIEKYPGQLMLGLSTAVILLLLLLLHLFRSRRQIGSALRERASLLNSLGEGVYGVDRDGLCSFINPRALEMLGFAHDEVIGADQHWLFHHHRPDGALYAKVECPIYQTLTDGKHRNGEEWFFRKNGEMFPVQYSVMPVSDGGRSEGAVVTFHDTTRERRAEEAMRIAAIAFETQEAMVVTDAHNCILQVNRAFTEVTGYTAEEAVGQTPALLKSGYHDESFYREMWATLQANGHWHGEIWNRRKNGEIYPEWLTISAVRNDKGDVTHYVAAFLDITQRKEAEEQIQFLAFYDPLTHLPNRRLLAERLDKALIAGQRRREYAAVLFIDLDNFKTLNDTMGHDVGDQLLRQVALRLRDAVRSSDTVARLGGDEFVILLEDLSENLHEAIAQIEHIGRTILESLGQPYQFGNLAHHCTASIGIIPFRNSGETVEHLLKSADMAMYKAKEAGKNSLRFFDPAMQTEVEERAEIERELRAALQEKQFVLHYQPQVDGMGRIFGAEALLRWCHPSRGNVPPGGFIGIAEDSRLILPIGQWVLEEACRQLARWSRQPATAELILAINVSALQFRDPGFVDSVAQALQQSGAPAKRLKLEITESLLLDDMELSIERMRRLKDEIGVGLALDDFGTGYSSLSYLKQLPLDQIKIDRSFVQDIGSNPNDAAIAETVIALGRSFELKVVAEGVETDDQRAALVSRGCDAFQGYLFGKPVPIEEFPVQAS